MKNINKSVTYIYSIEDENGIIRYIGKSNNPQNRIYGHLRENKGSYKYNWLHSIINRGYFPVVKIIDKVPFVGWEPYEIKWIAKYRELGFNLVNISDGGLGPNGAKKSKEKMCNAKKGIPLIDSHKKNISKAVKNKFKEFPNYNKCSDKHIIMDKDELYTKYITENLSINDCVEYFKIAQTTIYRNLKTFKIEKSKEIWRKQCKGKTDKTGLVLPRKTILKYDLTGKLVSEYDGLIEAMNSVNAPNPSNISQCCVGKIKLSYGYIWKYKKDNVVIDDSYINNLYFGYKRKVYQYDKNLKLVNKFESITQASKETGNGIGPIVNCCNNRTKICGGFIFKYN